MTNPEEKYQDIKNKTVRSMGWNYLSFGGTKLLSLVTLSILAHLLLPENFGLIALATLTMDYLSFISDLGFGAALIQKQKNIKQTVDTAFTINIIANSVLTLILFLIAPWVAAFFRETELTTVLRWLSLTFIIRALGSIHNILLERELEFKNKTAAELFSAIIKAAISIIMATAGFGVWSLVAGQLIGAVITTILLWYIIPWRPRLSIDTNIGKELFSYGASIMGVNAITAWEDNFDYLVIGRLFDTTALGIYTIAYRLPETLILNTLWSMTAVLFPAYSALQENQETLKKSFLTTVRYVETLMVPACIGLIIVADPVIRVVFGEKWSEAIPILQIICLYSLTHSIGFHAGDVYKAIGRPDILLKRSIIFLPIRILFLWIGAQFSLLGVAIGHLATEILSAIVNYILINKMIKVSFWELIAELRAFLGGFLIAVFAIPILILTKEQTPLLQLTVTTISGGIGYMIYLWHWERDLIFRLLTSVRTASASKK